VLDTYQPTTLEIALGLLAIFCGPLFFAVALGLCGLFAKRRN